LQNWERDDNPTDEHAKWFPLCEYVLQQKDPDYVHQIVQQNPRLRRPNLYNPSTATETEILHELLVSPASSTTSSPSSSPTLVNFVDPRDISIEIDDKVNKAMRDSELIAEARKMGFADEAIKMALMK